MPLGVKGTDMTAPLEAVPPSVERFRDRARLEFEFLAEYGFREEPIPTGEAPYLNLCAVWFAGNGTRVVVEGINYGMNARVAFGTAGPASAFENYDLGDLVAVRGLESPVVVGVSQLDQLRDYALILRQAAVDVLRGDRAIFPALAERVERRRIDFMIRGERR